MGIKEPKEKENFYALSIITTALWSEREKFSSWIKLEDALKIGVQSLTPLTPLLGLVRPAKRRMVY